MNFPRPPLSAALLAVATLLLAACSIGPDRKAMMEEARHSVPNLEANDTFFDGQIAARLTLGGANFGGPIRRGVGKGQAMPGMNSIVGDFGESQFGNSAMDGDPEGPSIGAPRGLYEGKAEDDSVELALSAAQRRSETEMPSALMRLQLQNTSQATVIVEIRQLNSDLGNFAVRPDTLTLGPGQTVEPEPVQSRLGVDSFELPVTITLRAGGLTETKVLTLHLVKDSATTPPMATAPAAHQD